MAAQMDKQTIIDVASIAAAAAAEKAVEQTLITLGFDLENIQEHQADQHFIRKRRLAEENKHAWINRITLTGAAVIFVQAVAPEALPALITLIK